MYCQYDRAKLNDKIRTYIVLWEISDFPKGRDGSEISQFPQRKQKISTISNLNSSYFEELNGSNMH